PPSPSVVIGRLIGRRALAPAVALAAIVVAATACRHAPAQATVASALEAVPLRLGGGQTIEVQLAGRQPPTACDRPPAGEAVRIHDGPLVISVPPVPPAAPGGTTRIVPKTSASYVVAPDGTATAWRDRTLAVGDEGD